MSKENEISSAEILHRNFSSAMFGYKKGEVEAFLEKIAIYIEELEKKLEQQSRVKIPPKKEEKPDEEQKSREDLISKTLMMAEKTKEDLIRNAQKEAEIIIREADLKGKKMLGEAKNLEEQKKMFLLKFKAEMEAMLKKINEDEILAKTKAAEVNAKPKSDHSEQLVEKQEQLNSE